MLLHTRNAQKELIKIRMCALRALIAIEWTVGRLIFDIEMSPRATQNTD